MLKAESEAKAKNSPGHGRGLPARWSTGRPPRTLAAVDLAEQEIDILGDLLAGDGVSTGCSSHFPEAG